MTSVWFVSAAHRRYDTVRLSLNQRRHACQQLRSAGFTAEGVIVADDDNLAIAEEYGFHAVDLDNSDVGGKFNAGIGYALNAGADIVVYIGSDNWAHPDLFKRLPGPREVVTGSLLQAVDMASGRMRNCRIDTTYGVIPWLIPRQLLDPCDGSPIQPGLMRGFDGAMIRGLTRANGFPPSFVRFDPHEYARIDWKTVDNLTSFDRLDKTLGIGDIQSPWLVLADWYPAEIVEFARAMSDGQREEACAPTSP